MARVVKVLWVASRAQGKKTDRRQATANDYTGVMSLSVMNLMLKLLCTTIIDLHCQAQRLCLGCGCPEGGVHTHAVHQMLRLWLQWPAILDSTSWHPAWGSRRLNSVAGILLQSWCTYAWC